MGNEYKQLHVKISLRTHEELDAIAKHYKENMSQIVKRLITETYVKLKLGDRK